MRTAPSFCVLITAGVVNVSCRGVLGPSCTDEIGRRPQDRRRRADGRYEQSHGCFAEVIQPADTTDVD
jgi:hypothetical protein